MFTEIGKLEEAQILALVAEENVLKDFKSVWEKKNINPRHGNSGARHGAELY